MYIKEVILDGFKSYATRTVISGFHPQFNAITGLNGSGKSNILDAICFVLGISQLASVRATNLADLVYKKGQAGITKATVSIIFINDKIEASPPGWQDCKEIAVTRQVIIGGKNKYFINGHNKTQAEVVTFFHSVQLNVNNPHFLIMQGKITKILNMKPEEILAMIEEVAGTRMFEDRKERAIKTMGKKDLKLEEIRQLLDGEITPKMEALRAKKRDLIEFQKLERDIDETNQYLIAYDYYTNEQGKRAAELRLQELKTNIGEIQKLLEQFTQQQAALVADRSRVWNKRSEYSARLKEVESSEKSASANYTRVKAKMDLAMTSINEEEALLIELNTLKLNMNQQLCELQEKHEQSLKSSSASIAEHAEKERETQAMEELLQTLQTGISASKGHENGYLDKLQAISSQIAAKTAVVESEKIKRSLREKELLAIRSEVESAEKSNKSLETTILAKENKILALKSRSQERPTGDYQQLTKSHQILTRKIGELERSVEATLHTIRNYLFSHISGGVPTSKRINGTIAELVTVRSKFEKASLALEICAGSRLFNVVVETEAVAAELLKQGTLRKRVTMIPLNKISKQRLDDSKIERAMKMRPGKVNLALNTIDYDPKVGAAIDYVFGSTFLCDDDESAKSVTFDQNLKVRSVTLDGDIYEPSGSLAGGSKPTGALVLADIQKFKMLENELSETKKQLSSAEQTLHEAKHQQESSANLQQEIDILEHELSVFRDLTQSNKNGQIISRAKEIQSQISQSLEQEETLQTELKELEAQRLIIQTDLKEWDVSRDSKIESLKMKLKTQKAWLVKSLPHIQSFQRKIQILEVEIDQLQNEIQGNEADIKLKNELIATYKNQLEELEQALGRAKVEWDCARNTLSLEMSAIAQDETELLRLESGLKEIELALSSSSSSLQNMIKEKESTEKEFARCRQALREFTASQHNMWIQSQKHFFGHQEGPFCFQNQNINDWKVKLVRLTERHRSMSRNLDRSVLEQFDKIERKETTLKAKLSTVLNDKGKITDAITALEDHKKTALEKTWKQVSRDFGQIFGELLPGNTATLSPAEGSDLMDGLEFRVCLGGMWKKNLSELSGGQRSLVALALILSLLQFKPAPTYILDEVDSALDESHTQNIGQLLRSRFKNSQFILVSLKDGMYSNANVLFRTRFKDGVSTVERIDQKL